MKEHSFFLLAAFPSVETEYQRRANWFMEQFEEVLAQVGEISNGRVGKEVLASGEVVTKFTENAEIQTSRLTGISIDTQITRAEQNLRAGDFDRPSRELMLRVKRINQRVIRLLNGLIQLKENILRDVGLCRLYTFNYPLLVEHILREAKLYREFVMELERRGFISQRDQKETEMFWNQIMMEHAQFIRGLLDPTECELMEKANEFAKEYKELLDEARKQDCRCDGEMKTQKDTLALTEEYQKFKTAGTEGLLGCDIRSIILPLLADHVLREANHYLRILK